MKKFLAFIFAFVAAALLCVAPAISQPAPQDEVAWFKPQKNVNDVVLSPDGTKLYNSESTGSGDSFTFVIRERNTQNGDIIRTFAPTNIQRPDLQILDLEISNDGNYLAAIMEQQTVKTNIPIIVFNLQTGVERHLLLSDTSLIKSGFTDISISPDSRKIIGLYNGNKVNNYDSYMAMFNLVTGDSLYYKRYNIDTPEDKMFALYQVEFVPDNQHFVVVGSKLIKQTQGPALWKEDRGLLVWDANNYQFVKLISKDFNNGHPIQSGTLLTVKFSAVSGIMGFGHDNMINFYNYHSWDTINSFNNKRFGYFCFSADGLKILTTTFDGKKYQNETLGIIPQITLYSYDSLYIFATQAISNDNFYAFGYALNGIYKLNAIWETTGIKNDLKTKEILSLYPNPSNNQLSIEVNFSLPQQCSITLSDAQGNKVSDVYTGIIELTRKLDFDLSNFSSGSYFITLKYGDKIISQSFIKEK